MTSESKVVRKVTFNLPEANSGTFEVKPYGKRRASDSALKR